MSTVIQLIVLALIVGSFVVAAVVTLRESARGPFTLGGKTTIPLASAPSFVPGASVSVSTLVRRRRWWLPRRFSVREEKYMLVAMKDHTMTVARVKRGRK